METEAADANADAETEGKGSRPKKNVSGMANILKSSFTAATSQEHADVDVNDPNFWAKVMPNMKNASLIKNQLRNLLSTNNPRIRRERKRLKKQQTEEDDEDDMEEEAATSVTENAAEDQRELAAAQKTMETIMNDTQGLVNEAVEKQARGKLPDIERRELHALVLQFTICDELVMPSDGAATAESWLVQLEGKRRRIQVNHNQDEELEFKAPKKRASGRGRGRGRGNAKGRVVNTDVGTSERGKRKAAQQLAVREDDEDATDEDDILPAYPTKKTSEKNGRVDSEDDMDEADDDDEDDDFEGGMSIEQSAGDRNLKRGQGGRSSGNGRKKLRKEETGQPAASDGDSSGVALAAPVPLAAPAAAMIPAMGGLPGISGVPGVPAPVSTGMPAGMQELVALTLLQQQQAAMAMAETEVEVTEVKHDRSVCHHCGAHRF